MQKLCQYIGCYHNSSNLSPQFVGKTPVGGNLGPSMPRDIAEDFGQQMVGKTIHCQALQRDMLIADFYFEDGNDRGLPPHDEKFRIQHGGRIVAVLQEKYIDSTIEPVLLPAGSEE